MKKRRVFCELEEDKNFFDWSRRVDWIITNPPWSKFRCFLNHSFTVTNKLVFLVILNHFQTKVLLLDTPKEIPQAGFQLCAALVERTESKSTLFCR